jgi:hypothetical protein
MTNAVDSEIDRQTDTLVALGYPALAGLSPRGLRALVEPLRASLAAHVTGDPTPSTSRAPFVLVVNRTLVPASARIELVSLGGRPGVLNQHFGDVDTFEPVLDVPEASVYAVLDVERGEEFCGVRPADAVATIDEGLCLLHAVPGALEKNRCFHTAASRGTDKRVPALWISKNAPTLGWCWEHNHHTWLGVASADGRLAA